MEPIKEDTDYIFQNNKRNFKWLEISLIFLVFFVAGGAPAPHVNETYYLTKAKHYWQPEWCAGDPFLESADAHTVFYWSIGWLANLVSLSAMAWIGRVIAWFLLAWSWQGLSSRICNKQWLSVVSAMLFITLIEYTNFAGEWVIGGIEGKCLAYAFVFCGLSALVDSRWNAVWPWMGLASAFHVLVGGWSVLAAGTVCLKQPKQSRPTLIQMLPSIALGAIFSLSGAIPALDLTSGTEVETTSEANRIYTFDRLPHHLAPLALPTKELVKKTIRFELLLFGFLLLWFVHRKTKINNLANESTRIERLMVFAAATILFFAAGMIWHLIHWENQTGAAMLLKYYFFRLSDIAVPLATSLATIGLINQLFKNKAMLAGIIMAFSIALPAWHLMDVSTSRYLKPIPPGDKRIIDLPSWRDACNWANENTPKDSLFLVPRHSQSFNWYAERPELVTWKEVPQDAEALLVWHQKYLDVFFNIDSNGEYISYKSIGEQGTDRIKTLAKKYNLDYVLCEEYPPLDLPIAYSNDFYSIYRIQ